VTHQLVVCVDDVSLLGKKINIIKKNAGAMLDTNEESGRSEWQRKRIIISCLFTRMCHEILM
jgi:hypothetical protein